ncbi:hypothetical protein BJX68DRAFT_251714 [Aspergillus pseudodeflectus]|uniref:Ubiquitin carboxyl-terminal hydrolase n=1 Tax=Aspergillus pseudodeflectus TaxID=176178 RepID=A0ABR4LBP5_9EURO
MEKKTWKMLENNPNVMNQLATTLGLSPDLQFYDVYSLDDPELLAHIPRPALALLVTIPLTPAWDRSRTAEDATKEPYTGSGPDEPVIWFKQTIGHACGSIGLLHSAINGPAADFIKPGSDLETIRNAAIPLGREKRAEMLYNSEPFERAHKSVELDGDSYVDEGQRDGGHFRGSLADDEDVLSPRALDMSLKRIIKLNADAGGESPLFSCIALAPRS